MMKKITVISFLFFGVLTTTTQAQESVNAAGGNATGSGGTVSYTIGQIDYTCYEGNGGSVSQGVQQFDEISKFLTDTIPSINLEMVVYPNPTRGIVQCSKKSNIRVYSIQGNLINTFNGVWQINFSNYGAGIYIVTDEEGNKLRVIKE